MTREHADTWDCYNELLLRAPADRITKILARYELYRRVVDRPGDVVECGVFKGAGLLYWAKLVQTFNPHSNRRVVGFDTFRGYPETSTLPYERASGERFASEARFTGVSAKDVLAIAEDQGLGDRIEIVEGDAMETIPRYARENPGFRIGLLNLDFDTFDPTLAALRALWDRVVPGGVVAFDDYGKRGWGESDAVDRFFEAGGVDLRALPWTFSPTAYCVKGGAARGDGGTPA